MPYQAIASEVLYIAKQAGIMIMKHYNDDVVVHIKDDDSPVTKADMEASEFIVSELARLMPGIPAVSEEQTEEENMVALENDVFWLIDPLDGTKSFVKKSGEFTVNIALIKGNRPVGGAIYVPTTRTSYFTAEDGHAYKQSGDNLPGKIAVRPIPSTGKVVVASLSHRNEETEKYIRSLDHVRQIVAASSSLKFCIVAEGKADLYPRLGPTMEWDTGAGQAILEAAGGRVENLDGSDFTYRKEGFRNSHFIARG